MASEFYLSLFKKITVKDGYLILGKGATVIRLADIKSFSISKKSLIVNGSNTQLTTIKGLSGNKIYAAMDFINAERDKLQNSGKNAKSALASIARGPKSFLRTALIVIILVVVIVAIYYLMGAPTF